MNIRLTRPFAALCAVGVLVTTPVPALAQDDISEARVRKIEAEIRALQRKVFPGGDGRFFEPEIQSVDPSRPAPATPSTTAVTDILVRLDAMEAQLQRLTGVTEENANQISQLETRIAELEAANAPPPVVGPPDAEPSAAESNLEAMTGGASAAPAQVTPAAVTVGPEAAPAVAGPSDERLAAVQAIEMPQTGDAGEDAYTYGFRLWNAGFLPEAQQQLSRFVEQHSDHWRISYGRNLLGRAYLDDGKAREAAPWFLRNYQTDKTGIRAGDSLLFLAEAMIALEDTNRACIALAEFGETYPALATGRLMEKYEANRSRVRCQ